MKKRHLWLLALSLIISICMCFSLAACKGCNGDEITPVALAVPVVSIDGEGVASWDSVPNASGYAYKINDGEENTTSNCSVTLTDKQSICVKAVGDGENYTDSEWSQSKTYTAPAPAQPVKLGKPVVTLNGAVASWNAVEHASGYKYSLDNGTTWVNATGTSVTLSDKQTVIVKAVGDGENYTDGDASAPVTYNATTSVQHAHKYTWTDNKDGTHSGVCANEDGKCDAPNVTNQEHIYDEDDECVCGAVRPEPAPGQHTHKYTWTNNNNGTHSGVCANEDGKCDAPNVTNQAHVYGKNDKCVCGADKPEPAPGQHTHKYTWTNNNNGTHSGVCANEDGKCDTPTVTNQTHVYDEDDKCVCGADKPVTPAPDTMTHAQYVAANKNDKVKVGGVVTAFRGKNVFLMDNDGGYYAFGATTVPSNLAVGMAVTVTGTKDEFNGLDEIADGVVEITNATPVTVTPVNITAALTNATGASDEALLALQNTYVVFTGVITSNTNGATIKVGEKDYTYYVGGTTQVVTTAQQTAIKNAFKEADTKTADVTAIVAVYKGAIQLVPANATPVTVHTKLATPELTLDENTGAVTWVKDANADKYAYKIGDGEISYIEKDETASVTIEDGDEITVWAVGYGPYITGGEAKKSYNKTPLSAPVVTKAGNKGAQWTAVQGAAEYGYSITKAADGSVVKGTTDKTSIDLANGDKIIVWAIGTGKYKNSVDSNEFEFEKLAEVTLDEPTFSIDRNGNVTIAEHHDTEIFKYVIGDLDTLEEAWVEGTIGTEGLEAVPVTGEISVPNGKAIVILAGGYTAEDGTIYKDSDWTEPAIYKAPAGTFDDIDAEYVEISLKDGKVEVVWAHEDGETFEIVLNGTPSTLTNSETVLDFAKYNEIKIKVLATNPESGYDYSGCKNESGYLDITDSFNTFVADEKIKVEKTALENFLEPKVDSNKDITLRTAGTTYSDVKITWIIEGGNDYGDIAIIVSGKLTIKPTADLTEINVIATLTCGASTDTKEFPIEIKKVKTATSIIEYTANTTDASTGKVGDKKDITALVCNGNAFLTVSSLINANSSHVGLNKSQFIRLHKNSAASLIVESTFMIYTIEITRTGGSFDDLIVEIIDGETTRVATTTDTDDTVRVYTIEANAFKLSGKSSSTAFDIKTLKVVHGDLTDEEKAQSAFEALPENLETQYTTDFTVDPVGKFGLGIDWTANVKEVGGVAQGDGSIVFAGSANNDGKLDATVTRGTVNTTIIIRATIHGTDLYKDYEVTVPFVTPAAPVVSVNSETGKATWNEVANAVSYAYQLKEAGDDTAFDNGTAPSGTTTECEFTLTDGQRIRVKAIIVAGVNETEWSTEKTYTVGGPAHGHEYEWVNNGDGTHKQHCAVDGCDEPDISAGNHVYGEDGKCVCGAVKSNTPITVTFTFTNNATADSSTELSKPTDVFTAACDDTTNFTSVIISKVYEGKNSSIKLGSGSAVGKVTLTFDKKVASVTVNLSKYGSDTGKVKVTNCDTQATPGTEAEDFEFVLSEATNTITIETTAKRCYIYSITVTFED